MRNKMKSPRKFVFLFRYGLKEHHHLFPVMEQAVQSLAAEVPVEYIGFREPNPVDAASFPNVRFRHLPFLLTRHNQRKKWLLTLLWIACAPGLGLYCRLTRTRAVWIDESLPLFIPLFRIFYRGRCGVVMADFFAATYGRGVFASLGRWITAWDAHAAMKCDVIFTRSKQMALQLKEKGVAAEQILTLYDPVDSRLYHRGDRTQCREALGVHPDQLLLTFHGVMHPNKGLEYVFEEIAPVLKANPHIRMVAIGNGPEETKYRNWVQTAGLETQITFTGYLPPDETSRYIKASDAGIVSRRTEAMNEMVVTSVLPHYLASGVPVLAANSAGIRELVEDGKSAFLFTHGESGSFRRVLNHWLNLPDRGTSLAEAGYRRAEVLCDAATCEQKLRETWLKLYFHENPPLSSKD